MSRGILIEKIRECDLQSAHLESEFLRSQFAFETGAFSARIASYVVVSGVDDGKMAWLRNELAGDPAFRITDSLYDVEGFERIILARHNGAFDPFVDTVTKLLLIKYPGLSGALSVKEFSVFYVGGDAPMANAAALTDYLLYTGEYRLARVDELALDDGEGTGRTRRGAASLASKENPQLSEPFMTTQSAKIMDRYVRTVEEMGKCVSLTSKSGATTEYSTAEFSKIEDLLVSLDINMGKDDAVSAQNYFLAESREPTEMELRIINRYRSERWSHSALDTSVSVPVNENSNAEEAHEAFKEKYAELGADPEFATLSDIIDAPWVNGSAALGVEGAGEIIKIDDRFKGILLNTDNGQKLLTFAHESNNTRTSVDPAGGASACLGESMRKLVRMYATPYDCMRVSGISAPYARDGGDESYDEVHQRALAREACDSFAAYARGAGVPCSFNSEYVSSSFGSKHMEVSAVLASLDTAELVKKQKAEEAVTEGDMILVIGKRTGRDGRVYNRYLKIISDRLAKEACENGNEEAPDFSGEDSGLETEVALSGNQNTASADVSSIRQRAEIVKREKYVISKGVALFGEAVPRGDASVQKKLIELCADPAFREKVKKIMDVDSSGIVTASSMLANGVAIYLDCVPVKYNGMSATEVAFSETCERMVVAVDKNEAANVIAICAEMGLICACIGVVTDDRHLSVYGGGGRIAYLSAEFLKSNESGRRIEASVEAPRELAESEALAIALKPIDDTKPLQRLFSKREPDHIGAFSNIAVNSKIKTRARKRRFDSNVRGTSVFSPMGDGLAMAAVSYIREGNAILTENGKRLCSALSLGMHSEIGDADPFKGAYYAVTDAVGRLIASGASVDKIHIATHIFHPTYRSDSTQAGEALASVLGIYDAQEKLGVNSICGDFSMGGQGGKGIKPAVAIFGIGTGTDDRFRSSEFKCAGNKLILLKPEMAKNGLPVPQSQLDVFDKVEKLFEEGKAVAAVSLTDISLAEGVMNMCFGSLGLGFEFDKDCTPEELYDNLYGAMAVEVEDGADIPKGAMIFGTVTDRYEIEIKGRGGKLANPLSEEQEKLARIAEDGDVIISVDGLMRLCYEKEKTVYETEPFAELKKRLTNETAVTFACAADDGHIKRKSYLSIQEAKIAAEAEKGKKAGRFVQMSFDSYSAIKKKISIVIPVFGGTIGEGLMIRALEECCFDKNIEVVPVRCTLDKPSLTALAERISNAGMLCIPDSDGASAVIAVALKAPEVARAITTLKRSGGLIYGYGAGLSVLLRLGLIAGASSESGGDIGGITVSDAPLSGLIRKQTLVRVASVLSPFMEKVAPEEMYRTEISSYMGRIVGDRALLTAMGEKSLIPTQYCDLSGRATMDTRYNPCASFMAVDSLTSEDGMVFGQVSLPLRAKNCDDSYLKKIEHLPIFESAIHYLT